MTAVEVAGCPSTSTTKEFQQSQEMVRVNQWVIIDEMTHSLHISHGSASQIIHDELSFHEVCTRWIPRELTTEQKGKHIEVFQCLLNYYNNDGEEFICRIVTGDETWVRTWGKIQVTECGVEAFWFVSNKEVQDSVSHGKGDANLFWGPKRADTGKLSGKWVFLINSARYNSLLANKINPVIHIKCRSLQSKKVLLLQDNAYPHMAA